MASILTPTRPPRVSRVRGATSSLTTESDNVQSLPDSVQLVLLRIRTIELPQLVEKAVGTYKAEVKNLSQTVKTL